MSTFEDASLVLIPSGYKASKVYSVKPTDGLGDLTFTRALDTATRVGPDGLIEKVRTNLALRSQEFDNAAWAKQQGGTGLVPVVTANNALAPDGTMTADTIVFDSGAGTTASDQSMVRQGITIVAGTFTGSFFARVTSGTGQIIFRHATGGSYTTANLTTTYQRFSSIEVGTAGAISFEFGIRRGLANEPINSSVSVEIWGCQLEASDFGATPYIPTTTAAVSVGMLANVPRLDYLGGGCPKLLLEPQRTNLVTFSEQLDNAAWGKGNATISANVATSPAGFLDADKFIATAVSGFHSTSQSFASKIALTPHTFSFFAKADEIGFCLPNFSSGFSGTQLTALINLSDGTASGVAAGLSVSTEDYGNGWYRIKLTATSQNNTSSFLVTINATNASGASNFTGDGTSGILIYGAQFEASAAYATSYIPTLAAAVTRSADAASKTGISALFGATSGTIFFETTYIPQTNNGGGERFVFAQETTSAGSIRLWQDVVGGNQLFRMLVNDGGVQQVNASVTVASLGISTTQPTNIKWAMAYEENRFVTFINGVQAMINTSGTAPSIDEINFNNTILTLFPLAQAIVFPTALTNAQLEELTA